MFSKKTDCVASGFEKKADDRPNKTCKSISGFSTKSFKAISQICPELFQGAGNCAKNCTDCDARGKKDGGNCNSMFFEDRFYFFS